MMGYRFLMLLLCGVCLWTSVAPASAGVDARVFNAEECLGRIRTLDQALKNWSEKPDTRDREPVLSSGSAFREFLGPSVAVTCGGALTSPGDQKDYHIVKTAGEGRQGYSTVCPFHGNVAECERLAAVARLQGIVGWKRFVSLGEALVLLALVLIGLALAALSRSSGSGGSSETPDQKGKNGNHP